MRHVIVPSLVALALVSGACAAAPVTDTPGPSGLAESSARVPLEPTPSATLSDEYVESRDALVGTYVCSEDGTDVTHLWDVREDGTITRVSGETGEALPAGTWSRDHGRLLTTFQGGMTWFDIQEDRLVIGRWACSPGRF